MPEYLTPGVYIEEISIGAKPIEGVSTSTAAFLGQTERGPQDLRLITGFGQYQALYGGYIDNSYLAYAVDGFFRNGGQRCYIGRIAAKDAPASAELTFGGNPVIAVSAVEPGDWGTRIGIMVDNGSLNATLFKLTIAYWSNSPPTALDNDTLKTNPATILEVYDNLSPKSDSSDYYMKRINGISNLVTLAPPKGSPQRPGLTTYFLKYSNWLFNWDLSTGRDMVRLKTKLKDLLKFDWIGTATITKNESEGSVTVENKTVTPAKTLQLKLITNRTEVSITVDGSVSKERYAAKLENDGLNIYSLPWPSGIGLEDYKGITEPGNRTGFAALEERDDISIVCVPDENSITGLTSAIVDHCELMKDRFAVCQASQSAGKIGDLMPLRESKYAAFYYPWITILDPVTNRNKLIPPGGHIAGVYARSDSERGVHKAPANEVLRGAVDLQINLTRGEQDILNPRGVNCIRAFVGRGIRIWGARTCSSDGSWKYVNVRRLFIFLEKSIERGTQWVVFEPNDEKLWARVKQTINQFLTTVWRSGALMGSTQEEAFFVKCDRTTMTQDDIDNGRLIIMVGVAPVKPAEFVIFRIAQVAKGPEISE